jgi:hypothetical protein
MTATCVLGSVICCIVRVHLDGGACSELFAIFCIFVVDLVLQLFMNAQLRAIVFW